MNRQYRILRVADEWNKRIGYQVQLKKHWWIFTWWEYLRDDTFMGGILVFGDIETAKTWAEEFLKGRVVEEQ